MVNRLILPGSILLLFADAGHCNRLKFYLNNNYHYYFLFLQWITPYIIFLWWIFRHVISVNFNIFQRRWSMHILEIVTLMFREQVGFHICSNGQ